MIKKLMLLSLLSCLGIFAQSDLEDINFPLNSSVVVDGFQGLDMLASVLAKHANLDLEVLGHTDSIGTADYNKRLSVRRAESVKSYLVGKGARESQIKAMGEGISQSFDNSSREGRFQNRRVSLTLFENINGSRVKVPYSRLLELFFGDRMPGEVVKLGEKAMENQDQIMQKLSELEKHHKALAEKLDRHIASQKTSPLPPHGGATSPHLSKQMQFGNDLGVSFGIGADEDGDFTGRIRGLYFRQFGKNMAVQGNGEWSYYDDEETGQIDGAIVYQEGNVKLAAAGSFKWASLDGLDTARIGQGALVADFLLRGGKIGVFGTFPFADGDVLAERPVGGAFVEEIYVNVPVQYGLNFGANVARGVGLEGHVAGLDGETEADLAAGVNLDVRIKENLLWYVNVELNESRLRDQDDSTRYLTGLRLGSWNKAYAGQTDSITPVDIPRVRYELLTRTVRRGNTAPVADAGASRTGVAEGIVSLDGSGSFDPEGDALSYQWSQTGGPTVQIQSAGQQAATFTGRAGEAYTFELQVTDALGDSSRDSVSITMEAAPVPEPSIVNFIAVPSTIIEGQLANLSWNTTDAEEVTLTGFDVVSENGQVVVSPGETTTYTLTATNESGSVSQSVTITVEPLVEESDPAQIDFFNAVPSTIVEGETSNLNWGTQFATTVEITGVGQVPPSGTLLVAPTQTTTYTITATNELGSVTQDVTLTVNPKEEPPPTPDPVISFFTATPSSIIEGDFTTLNWVTEYADSVTISGIGIVGDSGSLILSPTETTTYTLTALNETGTTEESVTVTVEPKVGEGIPPVADAGADQFLAFPGTVSLDGSASFDPDGGPLTYAWTQVGGPQVALNGADTANPSFDGSGGRYTFKLTVTDAEGRTDSDEVTVVVVAFKAGQQR